VSAVELMGCRSATDAYPHLAHRKLIEIVVSETDFRIAYDALMEQMLGIDHHEGPVPLR
jgi:hypothetical protein